MQVAGGLVHRFGSMRVPCGECEVAPSLWSPRDWNYMFGFYYTCGHIQLTDKAVEHGR